MKRPKIHINPWQYLLFSFIFLIFLGTVLLEVPWVKHQNGLSWIDALFTSTSAVCVTGLTTVSTSGFNIFGQIVLLFLMQAGAIGIMTITSSFLLILRGNVGLKHRLFFSQLQENFDLSDARIILQNILRITFITELVGAILLTIGFWWQGFSFGQSVYHGIFHSISAFCNAGFSEFDTSLIGMNFLIKYTISLLIIIGGIGYFVIIEFLQNKTHYKNFSLHTKIVIYSTLLLIFTGTIGIMIFERGKVSFTDSFFQSVTARTAGFNSIDLNVLHLSSIFVLIILMFIGASPGSTGGGIKTTNFFVIASSILSVLKGKTEVVVFKRTISERYILKAFATAIIYFVILSIGIILLLQDKNLQFEPALFESVSAMGTVGLSLGITPLLTTSGKLVIVALMFIGRVGPSSLAMATLLNKKTIKIKYPEGTIY